MTQQRTSQSETFTADGDQELRRRHGLFRIQTRFFHVCPYNSKVSAHVIFGSEPDNRNFRTTSHA